MLAIRSQYTSGRTVWLHRHLHGRPAFWTIRIHGKFFKISVEQFDAMNYAMMGGYKPAIILFNVAPYLALRIIG
jgi:hypothetical protein